MTPSLHRPRPRVRARTRGFTLIEVLVAIVILSFGLLGVVGLQAASLKSNRDARLQSIAILYARELAEMMRGNKDAALAATANPYLNRYSGSSLTPNTSSACLNVGSSCSSATDLANAQMTDWLARVGTDLPGADIAVCRDAQPYTSAGVPQWNCTDAATDPVVVKIGWSRASMRSGIDELKQADRPSVILSVTAGNTP